MHPRLLNLHLRPAKMDVELLAHGDLDLSSLPGATLSVRLMVVVQLMVMKDSYLTGPHLIHHQVVEQPSVEVVVPVELVHEGALARAI